MKKILTSVLVALLVICTIATVMPAQSKADVQRIAKVRRTVNQIGADENVSVKFLDGSSVKGRITVIGDTSFILLKKKTTDSMTINFAQVKRVRRSGSNEFADPGMWLGIALIPTIIGFAIWARNKD